jgi:TPR repeat protein
MDMAKSKGSLEELRHAAEQADATAQSELGRRLHEGDGVPKDLDEALKWLHAAAEQGEASAQNRIGVCYQKGIVLPKNWTGG